MDLQGQPTGMYLRIGEDREGRELGVQRQEEDTRSLAERLGVRVAWPKTAAPDSTSSLSPTST